MQFTIASYFGGTELLPINIRRQLIPAEESLILKQILCFCIYLLTYNYPYFSEVLIYRFIAKYALALKISGFN